MGCLTRRKYKFCHLFFLWVIIKGVRNTFESQFYFCFNLNNQIKRWPEWSVMIIRLLRVLKGSHVFFSSLILFVVLELLRFGGCFKHSFTSKHNYVDEEILHFAFKVDNTTFLFIIIWLVCSIEQAVFDILCVSGQWETLVWSLFKSFSLFLWEST